jgi:hypothetical protein
MQVCRQAWSAPAWSIGNHQHICADHSHWPRQEDMNTTRLGHGKPQGLTKEPILGHAWSEHSSAQRTETAIMAFAAPCSTHLLRDRAIWSIVHTDENEATVQRAEWFGNEREFRTKSTWNQGNFAHMYLIESPIRSRRSLSSNTPIPQVATYQPFIQCFQSRCRPSSTYRPKKTMLSCELRQ